MADSEPKIVEITDDVVEKKEETEHHDHPHDHAHDHGHSHSTPATTVAAPAAAAAAPADSKLSKAEKKSRKAIQKLGLEIVPDIIRVTIKRQAIIAISRPEVYRSTTSNTHVIFGEPKIEDLNDGISKAAQQVADVPDLTTEDATEPSSSSSSSSADDTIDAQGLKEDDIKMVMDEGKVDRAKAVKTLLEAKGDIVNAILKLTEGN